MLKEIVAGLPETTAVRSVDELRLVSHCYDTNSTRSDPIFFIYRDLDETFAYTCPVSSSFFKEGFSLEVASSFPKWGALTVLAISPDGCAVWYIDRLICY